MTWWNVSGLTPIAAWDAFGWERAGSAWRVIDRVSTNHLLGPGYKTRVQNYRGVNGVTSPTNGNLLAFTSTITCPTNFVYAFFARQTRAITCLYSDTVSTAKYIDRNGSAVVVGSSAGTTSVSSPAGVPSQTNNDILTAVAVTAANGRVFFNGVIASTVVPIDRFSTTYKGIGWLANNNNNNIGPNDTFYGAGFWAGTADATQITAIFDQLRAYITDPITGTAASQGVSRKIHQNGPHRHRLSGISRLGKRATFTGLLTITGRVIEDGVSACKEVRVYERKTHICRGSTWSDPVTGNYAFTFLDEKLEYYVLSFDDKGARPAQIRDRIVASG